MIPGLFYLNLKGEIVKTRNIKNIKNNDWEDIAMDDEYLYVADMGNNYDTRKNLSIIKIPKNQNSDSFEVINFSYPEQKSFNYKKGDWMFEDFQLVNIASHRMKKIELQEALMYVYQMVMLKLWMALVFKLWKVKH